MRLMRVEKREFAGEIFNSHAPDKREQELHESWQVRVCTRVFSTLMPRSYENKSCMRVDESWLDVTKGSKNSSQLSLKLGSTKFPIRQLRLSLLFPLECFSDRQLLQALLEISSKLTRTGESWRSDASLLGLCKKWSRVHRHIARSIVFSPNQPIAVFWFNYTQSWYLYNG